MHKTLTRQIQHALGENPVISEEWQVLFDAISVTYDGFDKDRALIERSLEISSKELKGLVSVLQATLESINEGIVVNDRNGKIVNYNQRFLEIWEVPENVVKTHDTEKVIAAVIGKVVDPATFRKNIDTAFDHPNEDSTYIVKYTDGKTIQMNSKPQLVENKNVGRVWSSRDITERLNIENKLKTEVAALERLNKAMVDRELKMIELKKKIKSLEEKLTANDGGIKKDAFSA